MDAGPSHGPRRPWRRQASPALFRPGFDDLIEPCPVVRELRRPSRHARRRRPRRHRQRRLLHVFLANDQLRQGLREQRQMQRVAPADPMRERIHQPRERDRVTVRGVEDLARVARSRRGEQRRRRRRTDAGGTAAPGTARTSKAGRAERRCDRRADPRSPGRTGSRGARRRRAPDPTAPALRIRGWPRPTSAAAPPGWRHGRRHARRRSSRGRASTRGPLGPSAARGAFRRARCGRSRSRRARRAAACSPAARQR